MKLRCVDNIVRRFSVARLDGERLPNGLHQNGTEEARCEECGELFGVHDLEVLKPLFRAHTCMGSKSS
jgi:formylmethanofuran dehydrogenase subunit E